MTTATRTVLFTDLSGYSDAVSRSDREGLRRLVAAHEAWVVPLVEDRGGVVVKSLGDSFLCVFSAATDALRTARSILETPSDGEAPPIRIAVATGDVEELSGDVFGAPVNRAARILELVPDGEAWFDTAAQASMIAAEMAWEVVGSHGLRGVSLSETLHRVVPRDRCWLPDVVAQAVTDDRLVVVGPGTVDADGVDPASVVLLDEVDLGRADEVLAKLPGLEPSQVWLRTYQMGPVERESWQSRGYGVVVATRDAFAETVDALRSERIVGDHEDTLVLAAGRSAGFALAEAGLALPAVPIFELITGYSFDLDESGGWGAERSDAVLRVHVDAAGPQVEARRPGVAVDGRRLELGERAALVAGSVLTTASQTHRFVGWGHPYVGALVRGPGVAVGVSEGQRVEIGREPRAPGMVCADRGGPNNLRWRTGVLASRVRKESFTLDRALCGRRQAAVRCRSGHLEVETLHPRCPTWVVRADGQTKRVEGPIEVIDGDVVVVGTSALSVDTSGRGEADTMA